MIAIIHERPIGHILAAATPVLDQDILAIQIWSRGIPLDVVNT